MKKNITVLIVEDEAFSAMYLETGLSEAGFTVCATVATGEDAVDIAERKNPDIILMDIRLAGKIDGIEAARMIHEKNKIPLIFTTGYDDIKIKTEALKLEPLAYFIKPVDMDELSLKITAAFTAQ